MGVDEYFTYSVYFDYIPECLHIFTNQFSLVQSWSSSPSDIFQVPGYVASLYLYCNLDL